MKVYSLFSAAVLAAAVFLSCEPEVKVIHVNGVQLSETSHEMAIGDRLLLTATVLPENATNKNITWICSPENVLSISQGGEVTAIGPGHGSVVVSTADGGFSAICNITVKDSTVDVESITLEP